MLSTLYVNIRYFESLSKLAAHAIQIVQQSMLILNFQETSLRNPGKKHYFNFDKRCSMFIKQVTLSRHYLNHDFEEEAS